MTNSEAQAYAIVAMRNLIKDGIVKVGKARNVNEVLRSLDISMYYLMDEYSEDKIVEKVNKIMTREDD